MKKKILSIILIATMAFSLNACGNSSDSSENIEETEEVSEEEIEKEISHDFDSETNQKEQFFGIAYEIPSSWGKNENSSDDNTVIYKMGKDSLILTYEDTNNYGENVAPYEDDIISNLSSSFENYSQSDRAEVSICSGDISAINIIFSWNPGDYTLNNQFLFFKHNEGLISFMFQNDETSEYDRAEDFNSVINSIHVWNAETDSSYAPLELTTGQSNALSTARDYLDTMAFSYTGLIEQLEYEGYSTEDATYAADNCGADWNEQAAKCAQQCLDTMSFSRSGLIEQLIYEGFTAEQAEHGATAVGY